MVSPAQANMSIWADRRTTPAQAPFFSPTILRPDLSLKKGMVRQIHHGRGQSRVILIQDIHLNREAQWNIAGILQDLINRKKVDLVAIEGAFEPFDFRAFRDFPKKTIREDVATYFLDTNQIGAPSYVGITSPSEPPPFVGVDDPVHYEANVNAYLDSLETKKETDQWLAQLERALLNQREKIFSRMHLGFDQMIEDYESGRLDAAGLVYQGFKFGWTSPQVELFAQACGLEKTLDMKQVERERALALARLAAALTPSEQVALIEQGRRHEEGHITYAALYQELTAQFKRHRISLEKMPGFKKYLRYVAISEQIDGEKLLAEIDLWKEKTAGRLANTKQQKLLAHQLAWVRMAKKLVVFELTPSEWERYKRYPSVEALKDFEDFYHHAEIRSEKMVDNLLSYNVKSTALVAGGFHTPHIKALLEKRGLSYTLVSPKMTAVEQNGEVSYLSVFTQEKSPLETIFAGRKLFVTPTATHAGTPRGPDGSMLLTMSAVDEVMRNEFASINEGGWKLNYGLTPQKGKKIFDQAVRKDGGIVRIHGALVAPFWQPVVEWIKKFFSRPRKFSVPKRTVLRGEEAEKWIALSAAPDFLQPKFSDVAAEVASAFDIGGQQAEPVHEVAPMVFDPARISVVVDPQLLKPDVQGNLPLLQFQIFPLVEFRDGTAHVSFLNDSDIIQVSVYHVPDIQPVNASEMPFGLDELPRSGQPAGQLLFTTREIKVSELQKAGFDGGWFTLSAPKEVAQLEGSLVFVVQADKPMPLAVNSFGYVDGGTQQGLFSIIPFSSEEPIINAPFERAEVQQPENPNFFFPFFPTSAGIVIPDIPRWSTAGEQDDFLVARLKTGSISFTEFVLFGGKPIYPGYIAWAYTANPDPIKFQGVGGFIGEPANIEQSFSLFSASLFDQYEKLKELAGEAGFDEKRDKFVEVHAQALEGQGPYVSVKLENISDEEVYYWVVIVSPDQTFVYGPFLYDQKSQDHTFPVGFEGTEIWIVVQDQRKAENTTEAVLKRHTQPNVIPERKAFDNKEVQMPKQSILPGILGLSVVANFFKGLFSTKPISPRHRKQSPPLKVEKLENRIALSATQNVFVSPADLDYDPLAAVYADMAPAQMYAFDVDTGQQADTVQEAAPVNFDPSKIRVVVNPQLLKPGADGNLPLLRFQIFPKVEFRDGKDHISFLNDSDILKVSVYHVQNIQPSINATEIPFGLDEMPRTGQPAGELMFTTRDIKIGEMTKAGFDGAWFTLEAPEDVAQLEGALVIVVQAFDQNGAEISMPLGKNSFGVVDPGTQQGLFSIEPTDDPTIDAPFVAEEEPASQNPGFFPTFADIVFEQIGRSGGGGIVMPGPSGGRSAVGQGMGGGGASIGSGTGGSSAALFVHEPQVFTLHTAALFAEYFEFKKMVEEFDEDMALFDESRDEFVEIPVQMLEGEGDKFSVQLDNISNEEVLYWVAIIKDGKIIEGPKLYSANEIAVLPIPEGAEVIRIVVQDKGDKEGFTKVVLEKLRGEVKNPSAVKDIVREPVEAKSTKEASQEIKNHTTVSPLMFMPVAMVAVSPGLWERIKAFWSSLLARFRGNAPKRLAPIPIPPKPVTKTLAEKLPFRDLAGVSSFNRALATRAQENPKQQQVIYVPENIGGDLPDEIRRFVAQTWKINQGAQVTVFLNPQTDKRVLEKIQGEYRNLNGRVSIVMQGNYDSPEKLAGIMKPYARTTYVFKNNPQADEAHLTNLLASIKALSKEENFTDRIAVIILFSFGQDGVLKFHSLDTLLDKRVYDLVRSAA